MIRLYAAALAAVIVLSTLATASAGTQQAPAAPTRLSQRSDGASIPAGGWAHTHSIRLRMHVTGTGGWLRPQAEIVPANQAFTGNPTNHGHSALVHAGKTVHLFVSVSGLKSGASYSWQARVVDAHGRTSGWVVFGAQGQPSIRIDTTRPTAPKLSSSTNPRPGAWYRTRVQTFSWTSTDSGSGIAGYRYVLKHQPHSKSPKFTHADSATFKHLGNGKWNLMVQARDEAGNWSKRANYKFNLMHDAPQVHFRGVSTHHFNPLAEKVRWYFSLNRWAHAKLQIDGSGIRGRVLEKKLGKLRPGSHDFTWNGRNRWGNVVRHGWYWVRIQTRDPLGNHASFAFGGIHVWAYRPKLPFYPRAGRHIVVSLRRQAIYAYRGAKLVRWSLATTGNPALPTPTGHFSILAKFHPFQFVSPWPPGSPYWYPSSWVSYAMEFQDSGYFIHDAPWRSVFGPGSNGPGQPGTNYGGTHGCVNVPLWMSRFLFHWSHVGSPVDIVG